MLSLTMSMKFQKKLAKNLPELFLWFIIKVIMENLLILVSDENKEKKTITLQQTQSNQNWGEICSSSEGSVFKQT